MKFYGYSISLLQYSFLNPNSSSQQGHSPPPIEHYFFDLNPPLLQAKMQPSANLALITACIAAFISHVYPRPTPADHVLSPRDSGPGGIDCNGYDSGAVQPKAPTGSSLTWYVAIPKGTLPANGLPLAKNNQGTGSALHDALRHKCGDGITFEK